MEHMNSMWVSWNTSFIIQRRKPHILAFFLIHKCTTNICQDCVQLLCKNILYSGSSTIFYNTFHTLRTMNQKASTKSTPHFLVWHIKCLSQKTKNKKSVSFDMYRWWKFYSKKRWQKEHSVQTKGLLNFEVNIWSSRTENCLNINFL